MDARWKVLLVASVSGFLVYLDVTVVNIAFPDIEAAFPDASRSGLAWVLAAYNITFAALLVPGGRLADRFGHRRTFFIGALVFLAASLACALAPSAEALVAARVPQAVGGALVVPAAQAMILGAFAASERGTALSLWVAAAAVAAALGPPLGGILVDLADWRWVFVANLPIGLVALFYAIRVLPANNPVPGRIPDPLGIAIVATAVGLLTLGIVQGPEWGWGSPAVLGSFAGAALLGPALVARARGQAVPAIDVALFKVRSFSLANLASTLMGVAFFGQLFAAVLFLTTVWGYGELEAGLALTPAPVLAAAAAATAGRRADRTGARGLLLAGTLIFAAGEAFLALSLDFKPAYLSAVLPGTALVGIGTGLAIPLLTTIAAESLPAERYAEGSAVNSATRQIGAALGVAAIVAIVGTPAPLDAVDAFAGAWLFGAAAALAAFAVSLGLPRLGAGQATGSGLG